MTSACLLRTAFLLLAAILVSIRLADAGTFKNPSVIDTAYDPIAVASADLNHDGKLDLVYIDGLGSPVLHVLLGKGDGTFAHGQDIALPAGICGFTGCAINVGDVTNDGIPDIILGGAGTSTAQVAELTGNGDGTFKAAVVTRLPGSNGNYPALNGQMGIGDVDGDGTMDLVVADAMNPVLYILLGDNTGKFTLKGTVTIYFTARPRVYLHDLNGDGKLDIVAIDPPPGGVAHVLLGNGNGTFQSSVDYSYLPVFLADMDADGHPDLICIQYSQNGGFTVAIATGNPDGTFAAPATVATPPANATFADIADYNGDGLPDLVFSTSLGISVMPSQGNLSYGAPVSSVAGVPSSLAPGDFNNDGHNDLAMGVDGGILILLGSDSGSFASADYYDAGHTVGVAAVADFDADGIPDIAVTVPATYPRLLLGTGSGTFNLGLDQNPGYNSQTPANSLAAADFNGDGKPDLISVQPSSSYPYGQSFVLFNAGNGTFSSPLAISAGPTLTADVNNDGRSDLVFLSNSGAITVLLGQPDSTFTTVTTQQWQGASAVAVIGDVNNDGKPDLLLYESQALRLWLGKGDGTFSPSNLLTIPNGVLSGQVGIADIDGDGNPDIIIAPVTNPYGVIGSLTILYGNGDGTFQSPQLLPLSHNYTQFVVADTNADNRPDLILTDGSGIAVLTNLGNRAFSAEDHYVAGQGISQLTVVDVNGDGFPDIVAANSGGTTVTVLLNQPNSKPLDGAASTGAFTVTPAPSNYSQPVTLKIVMSAPAGALTPTGSVTFYLDGSYITNVSLASGTASHVYTPALATGTHTFVAAYNGDSTYSPESFAVFQTVNPPVYATKTVLSAVPAIVLASQTVRLTATVTSTVTVPAGWVTFMDGTNSLGAQQVDSNGVALLDTSTLTAGVHQISGVYQGYQDPWNLQAIYQPSTSSAVVVTVNTIPTSTTISTSNSTPNSGTVVTFMATVTSGSAAPFGGASIYDGSALLGTVSLASGGTATFSTASLSIGSHSITAFFNANATFAASASPPLNITVTSASASLFRSQVVMNLLNSRSDNVLKAEVTTTDGFAAGVVTFLDQGSILGRVMPDGSGTAVLLNSPLRNGVHSLTASFSGSSRVAPAVSPEFVEQWPPSGPGFRIALVTETISISAAQPERLPISIIPIGNFQQPVHFACTSGVPSGYTCDFSPSSLRGGGISYLTLQPEAKSISSARGTGWLYGFGFAFVAFFAAQGRDRRLRCLFSLVVAVSLTATGCGTSLGHIEQTELRVLSIQAISGRGAGQIIHSGQVVVKTLAEQQTPKTSHSPFMRF